jgi:hypothetical protein
VRYFFKISKIISKSGFEKQAQKLSSMYLTKKSFLSLEFRIALALPNAVAPFNFKCQRIYRIFKKKISKAVKKFIIRSVIAAPGHCIII